ncbi:hypothetical protein, partial [Streptococcus pneumoniae]|uniref:hypothetical protein n=1 Tax=Streptococcus pneumoniae TaxID=1313 RepID=UPI001E379B40
FRFTQVIISTKIVAYYSKVKKIYHHYKPYEKATKTMPSCILSVSKLNYSSTKNYDEEHINL